VGGWKIKDCLQSVSSGNWWHVFTLDGTTNKLKWSCDQGPTGEGVQAIHQFLSKKSNSSEAMDVSNGTTLQAPPKQNLRARVTM